MIIQNRVIDPRECIEESILHFSQDISDKELLDLREEIYLKVFRKGSGFGTYGRDYYLRSRKKHV